MSQGYCCFRSIQCAGSITYTLVPLPIHKCSCSVITKISNKFHQEALIIIMFLVISAGIAFKLEKIGPTFSSFNPPLPPSFPSLPPLATNPDHTKQFQYLNIALNNKTGPSFLKFFGCEDDFKLFKRIAKCV